MLRHTPRAVVLVCGAAAADGPAVGSTCAGHVVVARFTCAGDWPSEGVLFELAQVAAALHVDETFVLTGAGGSAAELPGWAVMPLARDSNGTGTAAAS